MIFRFLTAFLLTIATSAIVANPIDSLLQIADKSSDSARFYIWSNIGLYYRDAGNFDSAQLSFLEALKYADTDAHKATYFHNQGSLHWRLGKYDKAVAWYDSAIFLRKKIGDPVGTQKSSYYLSLVYRDLSQYNKAKQITYSLVNLAKEANDSTDMADMYNHLGGIFLRLNQYDSASFWYQEAIKLRQMLHDSLKIADSYSNLGKIAREQTLYNEAIQNYIKALAIYTQLNSTKKQAYTYLLLGGTYWESKKYQEALRQYLSSQRLYERMNNKQQVASTLKNIGLIYRDIGNVKKAIEYHQQSLKIYREVGNKPLIGIAISILAGDQWASGDFNVALDTYLKALEIRKEIGNQTHIAGAYNNVALAYKSLDKKDSALINYQRALKIYTSINDQLNVASMLNNIGNLYKKTGNYNLAINYLNQALKLRRNIANKQGIGYSALNLGQVYSEKSMLKESMILLLEAEEVARLLNDDYLIKESCFLLSVIYEKQEKNKKSLYYYREFHNAEKRLQLDESIRRVADMQIRFEAEKRKRIVEKKDAALQQQAMRITYLTWGVLLMAILILVVIIAFIQKRKSNKLLALQNHEIEEQKAEIVAQRDLAEEQRDMITEQKEKITDSILYAKRIQNALLPPDDQMEQLLKQHFILFKPRDVVSGDFYYFKPYKQYTVIAAADCTGHGVPGAFMSMLGISVLNEIMASEEVKNAGQMLNILRTKVKTNLHQTNYQNSNSDGMDVALIVLDRNQMRLNFAGANNPLVIIRSGELITYEADRMPIGVHIYDEHDFKNHTIDLQKGDKLYLFSDGYVDQFGGKNGRKLMSKNFKKLLLETSKIEMKEQQKKLEIFFDKWKGENRQIDDMLVMGLEI